MTLTAAQITTDFQRYAEQRTGERARVMPIRAQRRIRLGDQLAFEFENEDTLRYQVQEMVFVERITDPAEVGHEIELYGRMLPDSHALCATMFIELEQGSDVREELSRLRGVQNAIRLEFPGLDDGSPSQANAAEVRGLDENLDEPSETVSVHVLRFELDERQRDAFRDPAAPVELAVDHPEYAESAPIDGQTRLSLLADLALEAPGN
jgi:hypothetical protein